MDERALSRRTVLSGGARLLGGAALATAAPGLLAACGGGPSGSPNAHPASNGARGIGTGPPVRGGRLVVGTSSEVDGVDPTASQWDTTGYLYGEAIFDPLAAFDPQGVPRPYLAQSIEPSPDYATWTITLRPGIRFHDGTPLDGSALLANLQRQVQSALIGPALSNIADVTPSGPMAVVVTMHEPWVPFPYYLADQPGYIAAPSMLTNPDGASHPVGTGPFVFSEWVPHDHFTVTANPRYWRQGLPYLDSIEFRPFVSPASMSTTMQAGGIDAASTTDQGTILDFRRNPSFVVVDDAENSVGQPDQNCIILNTATPPTNDLRVRQALAHAIDRPAIAKIAFGNLGAVSDGPFVAGSRFAGATGYPELDLSAATSLIRSYEHSVGPVRLTLGIPSGDDTYSEIAQLIQGMFQAIGVHSDINQTEQDTYIADAALGRFQADGWQQFSCNDPDENYVWWSTQTVQPPGQLSLNVARNSDAAIQAALTEGRTNPDPAARVAAYKKIATLLAQDLPYLWINRSVSAVIANPVVQNFNATTFPDGSPGQGVSGGTFRFATTWKARH